MSKIRSMTAFTRHEAQSERMNLSWEIKSVNHRYLDVSIRLPEQVRYLENQVRGTLRNHLQRGKVEVSLRLGEQGEESVHLALNEALVMELNKAREKLEGLLVASQPVAAADIMRWPGVLKVAELKPEDIDELALSSFDTALSLFIESREREGAELKTMILQRIEKIEEFISLFKKNIPDTLAKHKAKLEARLQYALETMEQVDNNRLEQELVIFAQKIDIEEELDRLEAHVIEVKRILEKGDAAGRQLDFLMQELNREANTTGSKSASAEQSQAVIDLKVCIEQMREQVQNIE